jgi:hypothetical protein
VQVDTNSFAKLLSDPLLGRSKPWEFDPADRFFND